MVLSCLTKAAGCASEEEDFDVLDTNFSRSRYSGFRTYEYRPLCRRGCYTSTRCFNASVLNGHHVIDIFARYGTFCTRCSSSPAGGNTTSLPDPPVHQTWAPISSTSLIGSCNEFRYSTEELCLQQLLQATTIHSPTRCIPSFPSRGVKIYLSRTTPACHNKAALLYWFDSTPTSRPASSIFGTAFQKALMQYHIRPSLFGLVGTDHPQVNRCIFASFFISPPLPALTLAAVPSYQYRFPFGPAPHHTNLTLSR